MHLIANLRKHFFHFRKGGIKGLIKFYQLNRFEEDIFSKKKLKWDNLGYWKVDPMPNSEELQKFYSQIYWLNNQYYKTNLLIPRNPLKKSIISTMVIAPSKKIKISEVKPK